MNEIKPVLDAVIGVVNSFPYQCEKVVRDGDFSEKTSLGQVRFDRDYSTNSPEHDLLLRDTARKHGDSRIAPAEVDGVSVAKGGGFEIQAGGCSYRFTRITAEH